MSALALLIARPLPSSPSLAPPPAALPLSSTQDQKDQDGGLDPTSRPRSRPLRPRRLGRPRRELLPLCVEVHGAVTDGPVFFSSLHRPSLTGSPSAPPPLRPSRPLALGSATCSATCSAGVPIPTTRRTTRRRTSRVPAGPTFPTRAAGPSATATRPSSPTPVGGSRRPSATASRRTSRPRGDGSSALRNRLPQSSRERRTMRTTRGEIPLCCSDGERLDHCLACVQDGRTDECRRSSSNTIVPCHPLVVCSLGPLLRARVPLDHRRRRRVVIPSSAPTTTNITVPGPDPFFFSPSSRLQLVLRPVTYSVLFSSERPLPAFDPFSFIPLFLPLWLGLCTV